MRRQTLHLPGENAEDAEEPEAETPGWSDDEVKQLGWDRFAVTDPEAFAAVDAAYEAGDYDEAQALVDKWKDENGVEKEDEFEGPNAPKKKRRTRRRPARSPWTTTTSPRTRPRSPSNSGVMNDVNAPLDRV